MNRFSLTVCVLATLFVSSLAFAHETQTVGAGDGEYRVIVGMLNEPAFTGLRTGLDLRVVTVDGVAVENLENSLAITLTAPDGSSVHDLAPRARWGEPGSYVDDFILTQPGAYTLHITGFINDVAVDLTFVTHDVTAVSQITFP